MFGKNSNPVVLIDIYKDKAMVEIELDIVPSIFSGHCLDEISKDTVFKANATHKKAGGV